MRSEAEGMSAGGNLRREGTVKDRPTHVSRRSFLQRGMGLLACATLSGQAVQAATPASRPSTSRASREEAIRNFPLRSLPGPMRSRIEDVISEPTIYRRLPITVVPCDPQLYLFLVRYPEVVVSMWQLMGVTQVTMKRTSPYIYQAQDGAGTVSTIELVYGTRDQHLFLAEGYYEGPLLPRRVTGRCVILLNSAYMTNDHQREFVSNRLDVFVQLDKVGAEIVAKTLHPIMGKTVDSNFSESARFISQISTVAENNGPGVQRLASRLTGLEPSVRTQFVQITSAIHQKAVLSRMATPDSEATGRLSDTRGPVSGPPAASAQSQARSHIPNSVR